MVANSKLLSAILDCSLQNKCRDYSQCLTSARLQLKECELFIKSHCIGNITWKLAMSPCDLLGSVFSKMTIHLQRQSVDTACNEHVEGR